MHAEESMSILVIVNIDCAVGQRAHKSDALRVAVITIEPFGGADDIRQHSEFSGWRLRGASMRNGIIHYQRGADIYSYDIAANDEKQIDITLATDSDRTRLRWIDDPLSYLEDSKLGGDNSRVAITARGRVIISGADAQRRVELPVGDIARARAAVPGVNGDWIYEFRGYVNRR